MLALLLAAEGGEPKPLEAGDLLLYLAIIAAATFFVLLAGFGYFTPGGDKKD